jgi:hypothetical protein
MDEWIDYYDSTHTIYASRLHRDLHFAVVARDIIGYISQPDAVVLDYACGEARRRRGSRCLRQALLAEPAGVRGRLIARFAPNTKSGCACLMICRWRENPSTCRMNSVAIHDGQRARETRRLSSLPAVS